MFVMSLPARAPAATHRPATRCSVPSCELAAAWQPFLVLVQKVPAGAPAAWVLPLLLCDAHTDARRPADLLRGRSLRRLDLALRQRYGQRRIDWARSRIEYRRLA